MQFKVLYNLVQSQHSTTQSQGVEREELRCENIEWKRVRLAPRNCTGAMCPVGGNFCAFVQRPKNSINELFDQLQQVCCNSKQTPDLQENKREGKKTGEKRTLPQGLEKEIPSIPTKKNIIPRWFGDEEMLLTFKKFEIQ